MEKEVIEIVDSVKAKIDEKNAVQEAMNKELEARIFDMGQKLAAFEAPKPSDNRLSAVQNLAKILIEKREIKNAATGIGQNGTGNIEVVADIVRGMVDKNKFASLTRQFWGDNAQVPIPVFLPGMAKPSGAVESDSGKSMDSTAALNAITLTPYEFFAGLEVSRLALYTTALEASMVDIFDDAFGQAWDYQILNGTGDYQFTGIYDATWVASVASAYSGNIKTAASATAVTWKELYGLAKAAKAKASGSEKLAIVIHPDIPSGIVASTGASPAIELEYLTKGTIAGLPVIESTWAPNTMTTGKYVACACDFNKYATAWVRDFTIEPVKQKGTSNVYEQGFMYANGKPLDKSSFFYLKLA